MRNRDVSFLQSVLPSYNVKELDLERDKDLLITRVLNYGTWKELAWIYRTYSEADIREVLLNPRRGMWFPKVLNFWETMLGIKIPKQKRERALFTVGPNPAVTRKGVFSGSPLRAMIPAEGLKTRRKR